MIDHDELFDSLLAKGLIPEGLAVIVKDPSHHLCAMARTGILDSLKAKADAATLFIAHIVVKNNSLYEVSADGSETFIKTLLVYSKPVPKEFKLI